MCINNRFFHDANGVHPDRDNSVHRSYKHFVSYFENRDHLSEHDFVIGCYFIYGWMPTILDLRGDLTGSIDIANRVKETGYRPTSEEIERLARNINGSVVGTSKLLHFLRPDVHAIWDSRVYRYLHQQQPYIYRLEAPDAYSDYLDTIAELAQDERFSGLLERFNRDLEYEVTPNRFIEHVMYSCGGA